MLAVGALSVAGCGDRGNYASGTATEREIIVLGMEAQLDESIARDIVARVANVERVYMTYAKRMDVRSGDKQMKAVVFVGERMPPQAEMSGRVAWPLDSGEYITANDVVARSRLAVIGGPVRDHLFGVVDMALGKEILIGGEPFLVKGVLGAHPPFEGVSTPDPAQLANTVATRLYVPFVIGVDLFFGGTGRPFNLRVTVEEASRIGETALAVQTLLAEQHGDGFAVEIHPVPAPLLDS